MSFLTFGKLGENDMIIAALYGSRAHYGVKVIDETCNGGVVMSNGDHLEGYLVLG